MRLLRVLLLQIPIIIAIFFSSASAINGVTELSYQQCNDQYGTRRFLTHPSNMAPPALYSYPGAGNTWLRLLIEHATGVYTGSVYTDRSLLSTLPGERGCVSTIAVKVHPTTHPFHPENGLRASGKCKIQNNPMTFKRFVLPIRDPYASIWSEYQRGVNVLLSRTRSKLQALGNSHSSGIKKSMFRFSNWVARADELAKMYQYMWTHHYAGVYNTTPPENIYLFKYEDLRNASLQLDILRNIIIFLHPSIGANTTDEQLRCAFVLADKPSTHRGEVDQSLYVTSQDVYSPSVTCHLWRIFGNSAAAQGYHIYNNTNCTDVNMLALDGVAPKPKPRAKLMPDLNITNSIKPKAKAKVRPTQKNITKPVNPRPRAKSIPKRAPAAQTTPEFQPSSNIV